MVQCIADGQNLDKDEWYCTARDVTEYALERLASEYFKINLKEADK